MQYIEKGQLYAPRLTLSEPLTDVMMRFGTPDEEGRFKAGNFIRYGGCSLFYLDENVQDSHKRVYLAVVESGPCLCFTVGESTVSDVKRVLGGPKRTAKSAWRGDSYAEPPDDALCYQYYFGDVEFFVYCEGDTVTTIYFANTEAINDVF